MNATMTLSDRDRAILRAVAAGRCEISTRFGGALVVDGRCLADQFTGPRLTSAGLIAAAQVGPARLTAAGRGVLRGAA